jgi:hypothetical protein
LDMAGDVALPSVSIATTIWQSQSHRSSQFYSGWRANELNNLDQQRPSSPGLSNHIAITEAHFSVAKALVILKAAVCRTRRPRIAGAGPSGYGPSLRPVVCSDIIA